MAIDLPRGAAAKLKRTKDATDGMAGSLFVAGTRCSVSCGASHKTWGRITQSKPEF